MRVASTVERAEISPGSAGTIPLDVVNTSEVIDALSVRVLGIPATATVRCEPAELTLFPDSGGELEVRITLPEMFPAGTYRATLVVEGRSPGATDAYHDVEIVVPPCPAIQVSARPSVVRTRGRALFTVTVANRGNTPVDVAVRTVDADRSLRTDLTPSTLAVPVGRSAITTVSARGPRQLLGSDRDRPLRVVAEAEGASGDVALTLRQRSTFSRGLITVLVLLAILAAWALAVTLGMREVLGADPATKVAPPSFYAASGADGQATGTAPAGALSKDGPLPAGVGATITGTVIGQADPAGVGRLTVDAFRIAEDGPKKVSSAATQSDGTYTLAGLFPGEYLLRISDEGYEEVWYPDATSSADAELVAAPAQQVTGGIDLAVTGDPASITGAIDVGEAEDAVVTVTAQPTWLDDGDGATKVSADADGRYLLEGLVAPGTYRLTFEADGFQPTTITESVLGGQQRMAQDVRLGAGVGSIEGVVTDGTAPLGGVQVTTTVGGEEVVVGTPTVGRIGAFVIPNVPTPATYVLTFTKDGYSTQTVAVDLEAGQTRSDVPVALTSGVGTISGHVVDEQDQGVGGVTVTAGGTSTGATATTLTAGDVGAFTITGIQDSGTVTLTFIKDGYASASVPVAVGDDAEVTLRTALGTIRGNVTDGGNGVEGVRVEATDGSTIRTATSTGSSGSFVIPELPAGTYTVTAVQDGRVVTTALVVVSEGATTPSLQLPIPDGD